MTFVDDNGSELNIEGSFAMTKQAVSFFNGSIKGDVSTTFTVDNNSVNRETLGYSGPQMTSQVAWTKQAFNRVRNGNILDRGYIVIQSEDSDSLSCFYVSGNSNWVQLLEGLITELDYTGVTNGKNYNVIWKQSNVVAYASATEGIIFPFVDWCYDFKKGDNRFWMYIYQTGNDPFSGDKSFNMLNDFYPCFYLHTLVSEIMNQNGLKIDGNILLDPIYKSLIITPSNGLMRRDSFKNVLASGSNQAYGPLFQIKYTSFTETQDPDNLFSGSSFTCNKQASFYFTVYGLYDSSAAAAGSYYIYKNGVSIYSGSFIANAGPTQSKSTLINGNSGDVFEVYYFANGTARTIRMNLKIETIEIINVLDYVNPSFFLPSIKSLDVLKFIINYLGCATYFNEYSKTITCNIIEKIKTESAYDWSEYYISHQSQYTVNQAKNNYLKWKSNTLDTDIKKYNSTHILNFGDGNIETPNTLKEETTIASIPFIPSSGAIGQNGMYLTSVPLINLKDDGEAVAFSSVAVSIFGAPRSTFTVVDSTVLDGRGSIVRITNAQGESLGYFNVGFPISATEFDIWYDFTATFSGLIYMQSVNYQEVGARILSVKPSTSISDFNDSASIDIFDETLTAQSVSSLPYATFTKQITSYPIDQWKNNLAIDNPESGGFTDPTIKELYFNKISRFFQNPTIKARFLLPEAVYQRFEFDQFIYLKTERLTGYFFVDSIVNYVDGNTPVEIKLYML